MPATGRSVELQGSGVGDLRLDGNVPKCVEPGIGGLDSRNADPSQNSVRLPLQHQVGPAAAATAGPGNPGKREAPVRKTGYQSQRCFTTEEAEIRWRLSTGWRASVGLRLGRTTHERKIARAVQLLNRLLIDLRDAFSRVRPSLRRVGPHAHPTPRRDLR